MADKQVMPPEETVATPLYEVLEPEEARKRLMSVRLEETLRRPVMEALQAITQGKWVHIHPHSKAEEKLLKAAFRKLGKGMGGTSGEVRGVRFERATDGFIVRAATAQEHQLALARGKALTAARDRQKEQLRVAQSIMAQPLAPEGAATGETPFADEAEAVPEATRSSRRSRRQEQALSPGAEEGEEAVPTEAMTQGTQVPAPGGPEGEGVEPAPPAPTSRSRRRR
jgi:hypothetical protein